MKIDTMIASHPHVKGDMNAALVAAVAAARDCALVCTSCADACLGEEMVADLRQCIRYNLDCGDVCVATARVATRRTGGDVPVIRAMLEVCEASCRACGEECSKHAEMHEHCRICAESCARCAEACRSALATLG